MAVSNGAEALDALANAEFDALVLDVKMPVMDGEEALARIRDSKADFANIPIIIASADVSENSGERWLSAGANAFIAKPFNINSLTEQVRNLVLDQETAAKAARATSPNAGREAVA